MNAGAPLSEAGAKWRLPRLRLLGEIALWRHGLVMLGAIVLVALTGVTEGLTRWSIEREAARLAQDREEAARAKRAAQERSARSEALQAVPSNSDAQRHQDLLAVLAPHHVHSDQVRHIYALAAQQRVAIQRAEFQSDEGATGIGRLQVSIPVKATYPQLRRFLEACLMAMPNASLDRLSFKRNQVGDAEIEAKVHLSLWLRDAEGAAASPPSVARVALLRESRP